MASGQLQRLYGGFSSKSATKLQTLGGDRQQHRIATALLHYPVVGLGFGLFTETVEQGVADQQLQPQPQRVGGTHLQIGQQDLPGIKRFTPVATAI